MRRSTLIPGLVAAVISVVSLGAQAPANFAGKWTLVPDPAAPAGGGRGGFGGGLGQEATIAQDATTLTVTRTTQMGEFKSVYNLDGSDSKNTLNFNGQSIDQISKAKWDGGKLSVVTSIDFGGNTAQLTMVLSLDSSGNLVVDSTRPDFQGGGAPITTKTTYKKN